MSILPIIAGFGGGVIGAYMGALPAFIMTGIFALVGACIQATGLAADVIPNVITGDVALLSIAFASFVGPHTAFAGGVAAAAYAGKKGELANGADIVSSLNGLGSPDVLLMGGLFGALGATLIQIIAMIPTFGAVTDTPGTTVIILAIVCRLLFGKSGLTGVFENGEHELFSKGKAFGCNVVLGLGLGIAISATAAMAYLAGNMNFLGMWPFILFGFSAITLIFTQTGFATPATHHITLIGGYASVIGITAWGVEAGMCFGVLFAIIASLLGDFFGKTFNTNVDTHIDPPAFTIWILATIVHLIGFALGAPLGGIIVA